VHPISDLRRGGGLLLVENLSNVLGLSDPGRPDGPEGKWAARRAQKTGRPLRSETAPLDRRVATLRKVLKKSKLVVLPTMVNQGTDRQSALHLAEILNESKLCRAEVAPVETVFELDMSGDAVRLLWDLAREFRSYAKEPDLDADYLLYTHYYFYESSEAEESVGLVLYILCDREKEWVVVESQGQQSEDFKEIAPKTVSDCKRLVARRLEFHSTPQKVVGIGVSIKKDDFSYLLIAAVLEKGPAGQASLEVNDVITRVDGQEVKDLTIKEAVDRITGEPGTKVTIAIRRGREVKDYTLTRREVVFE
jgi:hypothetical protein